MGIIKRVFSTSRLHGQIGNIGALQFLFAEFLDVFSQLIVYVLDGFGRPGSIAHHDHWAIAAVFQAGRRSPGDGCRHSRFHYRLTAIREMHRAFTFDIKRLVRVVIVHVIPLAGIWIVMHPW
jgi:hypothetical protein